MVQVSDQYLNIEKIRDIWGGYGSNDYRYLSTDLSGVNLGKKVNLQDISIHLILNFVRHKAIYNLGHAFMMLSSTLHLILGIYK